MHTDDVICQQNKLYIWQDDILKQCTTKTQNYYLTNIHYRFIYFGEEM